MPRVPLGYQQVTATGSAFSLTVPAGAKSADLIAEAQNLRYRDDGTAPTASVGQLLPAGTTSAVPLTYFGNLSKIQFIAAVAGAILNVLYYKT